MAEPSSPPWVPGPGGDGVARDRDPAGRARNARPRDELGRPLPRGADGVPQLPDQPHLTPAQSLAAAQELLDAGRPFSAHEVLEAAWKAAPAGERELWRGLAQLAVGLTHASRGNPAGTVALLRRAAARIGAYAGAAPHAVDAAGLAAWASASADQVEASGLDRITSAPRLLG